MPITITEHEWQAMQAKGYREAAGSATTARTAANPTSDPCQPSKRASKAVKPVSTTVPIRPVDGQFRLTAEMVSNGSRSLPESATSLERRFASLCRAWVQTGEILQWAYEPVMLVTPIRGARTRAYTPDFLIMMPAGWIRVIETKGTTKKRQYFEAASLRMDIARMHLAEKIELWQWIKGEWKWKV